MRARLHKDVLEKNDVQDLIKFIKEHELFKGQSLYRVFYYDGMPRKTRESNPLVASDSPVQSDSYDRRVSLFKELREACFVAVRLGTVVWRGWNIHPNKLSKAKKSGDASINVSAKDITPDIQQKGVDMRIGIDIASISLKRYADVIVFVGGDSDFIPALKFARTEGRQVILFTLGHRGVLSELKASADVCVESSLNDLL